MRRLPRALSLSILLSIPLLADREEGDGRSLRRPVDPETVILKASL